MALENKLSSFRAQAVFLQSCVTTSRGIHKSKYQKYANMTADGQTGGVGICLFHLLRNLTHAHWVMNHPCIGRGEFTPEEPDDTSHSQKQEADPGAQQISGGATRWYHHLPSPWMAASDPEPLSICSLEDEPAAVVLEMQLLCGWPHSNKFYIGRILPDLSHPSLPCVHSCCHRSWVGSWCLPSPSSKVAQLYMFSAASSSCPPPLSVWMLWLWGAGRGWALPRHSPKGFLWDSTHRYCWGWTKELEDGLENEGGGSETWGMQRGMWKGRVCGKRAGERITEMGKVGKEEKVEILLLGSMLELSRRKPRFHLRTCLLSSVVLTVAGPTSQSNFTHTSHCHFCLLPQAQLQTFTLEIVTNAGR